MLYAHSKYSESNSVWILLVNKRRGEFGEFFTCSSNIIEVPSVALCAFKMSRKVLNEHSKYGGSCFILSGLRDKTELLMPYFECALSSLGYALCSSKRIQNINDNFEWFWSLSIRNFQARHKLKRQLKKDLISRAFCQHQGLLNAIS